MTKFHTLGQVVNAQYQKMVNAGGELFKVDTADIWETYLASFPEGTNPMFRERTEHDCSTCKNFVRNIGNVISLSDDGKTITTAWDVEAPEYYGVVAATMAEVVKSAPIVSVWRTKEQQYGKAETIEYNEATKETFTWSHFEGRTPDRCLTQNPGEDKGRFESVAHVLERGLVELHTEHFETVLELIDSKSIYRGEEHRDAVKGFFALKARFDDGEVSARNFAWANVHNQYARFKNTVIGTLIEDLSKDVFITDAVKSFESKVAPANYKRPKALITPSMVKQAMETLTELDLEGAVERRHATIEDVSVSDVLWVDGTVQPLMKGGVEGLLLEEAEKNRKLPDLTSLMLDATPTDMESFLADVLPNVKAMQVGLTNDHLGNFMSLTAPVGEDVGNLFQWDNDFAWSYDGDVTDSITQRVKRAGGNVDAELRVSLAWTNTDDLDIHAKCPDGHIYFGNPQGVLDVDMNAQRPYVTDPVENLSWTNPSNGHYEILVHNYSYRGSSDVGFTLEMAAPGILDHYRSDVSPPSPQSYAEGGLSFDYKDGAVLNLQVGKGLKKSTNSVEKWGLQTQQLVDVTTLVASPNHWGDNSSGNKHWFFILKDCLNPDSVRGIYNEFLRNDLTKHRKVFEVLGSKTKCEFSDRQLSGVGFSSTMAKELLVVVDRRQAYVVKF